MGMIPTHEQLGSLGDQDLVDQYNAAAQHTVVGTGFYLDELNRRPQARQSAAILELTRQVRNLTVIITLLTIINVALVAVTVAC
jgi:signal transduction histidine kinase